VDRGVLDFVKATVFDPADFTIRTDGVVRLNPQLAQGRSLARGNEPCANAEGNGCRANERID